MRQPAAKMIRASLAIAAVAAGLVMASAPTSAQTYLVNGHAASLAEANYLAARSMPAGNWRIDGWGIGPADTEYKKQVASNTAEGRCWYVLDVQLGDCGVAGKAIARHEPDAGSSPQPAAHVQLAAAEAQSDRQGSR